MADLAWSHLAGFTGRSKKNLAHHLPPTHQFEAANAQPISPDGTCVTELSKVFFARPCKYVYGRQHVDLHCEMTVPTVVVLH